MSEDNRVPPSRAARDEAYVRRNTSSKSDETSNQSAFAHARERAKRAAYEKTPDRFKNASGFQVRFRTGVVYFALSILCVLSGEVPTVIYLTIMAGICAGEFCYMMRVDSKLPNEMIGVIGAVAYPIAMWQFGMAGGALVTIILMMALLIWYVYWMRARISDVAVSFFGATYTGMLLSSLILLRQTLPEPWGGVLILSLFCSIWFNDVAAYMVGSKIGRHRLAPRTSPKKSWEGFIAGLVASALVWIGMSFIPGVVMPLWQAILFGVLSGAAGVVGDLAESRIKRNVGVKDSGTIMPGHGGLLDRCDSLFVASITAVVLLFSGGCLPFPV